MRKINPIVSIIIPTYNRASDLKRALNSVLEQSFQEWEAIVVDNHSNDDTDNVVQSYNDERIRLFKIHNHGIIAASRNAGIKNATGKYIAFLDSDDWWTVNKLSLSVDALEKGYDIVYHDLWMVTTLDNLYQTKYKTAGFRDIVYKELLCKGNKLINSSVVVRSEVLAKTDLLSEKKELIASEDYEFWIKIALVTNRFYRLPECSGFFWYGGDNLSKSKNFAIAANLILEKYKDHLVNSEIKMAKGYHNYLSGIYSTSQDRKKEAFSFFYKSIITAVFSVKIKALYRIISLLKSNNKVLNLF